MIVRCPGCKLSFIAEDHIKNPRKCIRCQRLFIPEDIEETCYTCRQNWADFKTLGGEDKVKP